MRKMCKTDLFDFSFFFYCKRNVLVFAKWAKWNEKTRSEHDISTADNMNEVQTETASTNDSKQMKMKMKEEKQ